ncbi:MAG: hypothetical protein VKK59_03955, partial [Vampirovibrionales bacterium]|nr:hypothetical protein [Vampirovibrionales bacterium]
MLSNTFNTMGNYYTQPSNGLFGNYTAQIAGFGQGCSMPFAQNIQGFSTAQMPQFSYGSLMGNVIGNVNGSVNFFNANYPQNFCAPMSPYYQNYGSLIGNVNGSVNVFGSQGYTPQNLCPPQPIYYPQNSSWPPQNPWSNQLPETPEPEPSELPPIPAPVKAEKKSELPPIPEAVAPPTPPAPPAKVWKTIDSATIIQGKSIDRKEAQRLVDEINKQNGTSYSVDQLQGRASIKKIDSANDLRQLQ